MSERYYITGVQIGLLKSLNEELAKRIAKTKGIIAEHTEEIKNLLEEIEVKQFVGNIQEGKKVAII